MKTYNELQLAKELMRFPSITPIDAGTMNFLAKKLRSLGFKCKILEFKSKNSKTVKNLYARLGKVRPIFVTKDTQMLCRPEMNHLGNIHHFQQL